MYRALFAGLLNLLPPRPFLSQSDTVGLQRLSVPVIPIGAQHFPNKTSEYRARERPPLKVICVTPQHKICIDKLFISVFILK